ncbi:Hypothetical protein CINCED_3A004920 [Cinara cedri]|uniref:Secreted protein n=1 Tax=Cinara cedri TaxID=506608 RepID=A0A5E4NG19_9HEMI|nr:Hypothetical protein CINCED_3A004920 [Cinara cedri]
MTQNAWRTLGTILFFFDATNGALLAAPVDCLGRYWRGDGGSKGRVSRGCTDTDYRPPPHKLTYTSSTVSSAVSGPPLPPPPSHSHAGAYELRSERKGNRERHAASWNQRVDPAPGFVHDRLPTAL